MTLDSWSEIARRQSHFNFASKRTIAMVRMAVFEEIDYFCAAYKMIFAKSAGPLKRDVAAILGRQAPAR